MSTHWALPARYSSKPLVNRADRLANLGLLALSVAAWAGVVVVLLDFDPTANGVVLLAGALLIGAAVSTLLMPLLWLVGFASQARIAFPGDWWRAGRRAAMVGLILAIFVVLQGENALNLPLALFVVAMAVLVELTLSLRR